MAATAACNEVKTSKSFHKLLELILLIGNVMNSGSKNAESVGFEISFLPKVRFNFSQGFFPQTNFHKLSYFLLQLSSTKDIENKQTLMHYLFEIVEQHYPDCQLFIDDLFHVEAASRVSPDLLQKSLRQMESNIKGLEMDLKNCNQSDPDDKFVEVLGVIKKKRVSFHDL